VVYNGVDFGRFTTLQRNNVGLSEDLGIDGMGPVIGMVASLTKLKDQETLIRATPAVISRFPKACFLFVGDGPRRRYLEELGSSLGVDRNLRFVGYRSDVDSIYGLMDGCVLTTHLEGISNALLEAMISGVPVVATRGGGTDELIRDGETGLLVPHGDVAATSEAVAKVLEGGESIARMRGAAKAFVEENFALHRYVEAYYRLYSEVLKERNLS